MPFILLDGLAYDLELLKAELFARYSLEPIQGENWLGAGARHAHKKAHLIKIKWASFYT